MTSASGLGETALVIGGSRGIGNALVKELHDRGLKVYATVRGESNTDSTRLDTFPAAVTVIGNVDLEAEGAGADALEKGLEDVKLDLVIFAAGIFKSDSLSTLNWKDQISMFSACALAPAFIASRLYALDTINAGGRFLLLTSEGGSIALRTKEEGGGQYGHHTSKAAANMVGRLLSIDFRDKKVAVLDIHPGFMKTDMTKGVGFDKYYESGGAVEPAEAAVSLLDYAATITMEDTGKFIAPRGPRDVGQAELVMGKDLPTPLELPW